MPAHPPSQTPTAQLSAATRANVDSFIVMDVMDQAATIEQTGAHVIHMEVGQPGSPAPRIARQAAAHALETDALGYTLAAGRPSLRDRIAQHYADTYGQSVDPARIIVTTGSSAGFVLTFLALFEAGTNIGLPVPGYPCYRQILKALSQCEIPLTTGPETRWMPTVDAIAAAQTHHDIKGLLIASPANPTGTMLTPDRLAEICAHCDANNLWFLSDEIYHGLTYGALEETALAHGKNVIVINSFSKYFSMTGWRIGWLVVPEHLARTFERLQQNLYISPPTIAQVAAEAAFAAHDELDQNRQVYARNREILLAGLSDTGFGDIVPADGAFYLYCNVSSWCDDAAAVCQQILQDTHVAITPGIDFDKKNGHRYVRFSYARSTNDVQEGLKRLREWWAKRSG